MFVKVTPVGKAPVTSRLAAGKPVLVTVNVPGAPCANVAALALEIAGAWFTVRVKVCWAGVPPFEAVKVSGYEPPVVAFGVPARVAVPSPLFVKVTPAGSVPAIVMLLALGAAEVVTVKAPKLPTTNVEEAALVKVGVASTDSTKFCVADGPTPFWAENVTGYAPALPGAGVPASVPVPFEFGVKVMPGGRAPAMASVALGNPVLVTVNALGTPRPKRPAAGLVIAGAWLTVSVNDCTAGEATPFDAEIVRA